MALQPTMDNYLSRSTSNSSLNSKRPAEDDDNQIWHKPKRTALRRNAAGTSSTVSTANRYENLPVEADSDPKALQFREASMLKKKRSGHIPPIIIDIQKNWTHQTIIDCIGKYNKNFHLQYRNNNKVAVVCYSPEAHQSIKEGLRKEELLFLTYTRKDEKKSKVVIRGLPSYAEEQLANELESIGFEGVSVIKLKSKSSEGMPCPPFLVQLPAGSDIRKFRQIRYLCNCVVEIQKYKANSFMGTQCFRCQGFGHTSSNCNMPPRCVKCKEAHSTRDCLKKDRTEPAECCNCSEKHPANYMQCIKRQQYLEKLQSKRETHVAQRRETAVKRESFVKHAPHPQRNPSLHLNPKEFPYLPSNNNSKGQAWKSTPMDDGLRTNTANLSSDQATEEMLTILKTIQSLKNQFLSCNSMMDKIILIITHLGCYV